MKPFVIGGVALALAASGAALAQAAPDLAGLWEAKRSFGPEVKGRLLLVRRDGRLVADIAGHSVPVTQSPAGIGFTLPDGRGSFRGRIEGRTVRGFWIQPADGLLGRAYSTPVTLAWKDGAWRGEVIPLEEANSYYLPVTRGPDGKLAAYLRNPERNEGLFQQVKTVVREGDSVRLVGNRRGQTEQVVLREGRLDAEGAVLTVPGSGGSYDFVKLDGRTASPFYPRGPAPVRYSYAPPVRLDDGWPVATLEEVGLSRPAIEAFVQGLIDTRMDSVNASQIHSVLIARHGKLVLEEYFHGHDRDRPHDTRSAGKSMAAVMVGAAMQAGLPVGEETPVYATMLGTLPAGLDPRKRAMKLGHLLTMTGGHFCNDNNSDAPASEDRMQTQLQEPDWYRFILAAPLDREPGEKIVYCGADPHLAGGVLSKAVGEPLPELFDRLIARPLRMGPYHLNLSPTGEPYLGGGGYFRPRDFMKLPQLMVNGGTWEGRRIVSRAWALRTTAALRDLSPTQQYGYLWNSHEYPWKGRRVRGFFAAGNGGQIFMGVPDLDLVIAFTGGNYGDTRILRIPQTRLIPELILPAVN